MVFCVATDRARKMCTVVGNSMVEQPGYRLDPLSTRDPRETPEGVYQSVGLMCAELNKYLKLLNCKIFHSNYEKN